MLLASPSTKSRGRSVEQEKNSTAMSARVSRIQLISQTSVSLVSEAYYANSSVFSAPFT